MNTAAVAAAKAAGAEVIEIATGIRRWTPAPKKVAKVRHVLIREDGSQVEFSRCKK